MSIYNLLQKLIACMLLLMAVEIAAKPNVDKQKTYHVVCTLYANGCVVDGSEAGASTPLSYLTAATTDAGTYWIIEEQQDELYTIRNVATQKYITYDGQRTDGNYTRRYVDMTSEANGLYSLWSFVYQGDGVYSIRNAAQTDHIWDVREGSMVVGTYSNTNSGNANQRFSLYDANGNQVTEVSTEPETPEVKPGIDVSSWIDAKTEAETGWNNQGSWKLSPSGNYVNGNASVSHPFMESWHDSWYGGLGNSSLSQTMNNLPAGEYTMEVDMIAVRQGNGNGTPATGVTFFVGNATASASTYNNRPVHYVLTFTLTTTQAVTLGVRLESTTANWVALDNLKLTFHGTNQQLITGERAKLQAELIDRLGDEEAAERMKNAGNTFEQMETLRKQIASMPVADPISRAAKNLSIGGHPVIYVESTDIYLCPIPKSQFGKNLSATISYTKSSSSGNLTIDGQEQAPGSSHTFASVAGGKNYTLSVTSGNGTTTSKSITFTSLPVVQLTGTFNDTYSEGSIIVNEPSNTNTPELLSMKAKWRGGITNSGGKHKRNYHVKLKDANGDKLEKKFFGLRNDNSWILEACQVDMARVRNRTMTDLWNDFSTPPYYIDKEPKALTGSRGQFVELVLNGEYRGIYCMTENMDRKQMKLKKYDESKNEYHGQLWKSKDWSYATLMGTRPDGGYQPKDYLSTPNSSSEMWDSYEVKYPDFEDMGNKTDWSTLYNACDFVAHSTDEEFTNHIAEYFDLPQVIDYYILMETTLATDNHGKNMFFGVYDQQADKRICFGLWDMDASCGQRWSDDYYHSSLMQPEQDYSAYISRNEHGDYNLFKRLRDTNAENFNLKVRRRYSELRKSYLATSSILNRFSTYFNDFKTAGSDQREYARWSYDSDVAGKKLDFDNEMEYLTSWFTRRMDYLDNTRFNISALANLGDVNGDGRIDIADAVAIVNHVLKKPSVKFVESAADVNCDNTIDIADAVAVVNIILKKTSNARTTSIITRDPE